MIKSSTLLYVSLFLALLPNPVEADQIAVTKDGRDVLLKDDGTWHYVEKQQETSSVDDFRKAKWGVSKYEVKNLEKTKIAQEDENILMYQGKLSTFDVFVGYIFASNKLVRGVYVIDEKHMNKTDYIADYSNLKALLEKKYGEPTDDQKYWKNDLYQDDPQDWGTAISVGHLVYFTSWETERTKITMLLTGDNFDITHKIEYQSKALKGLEEKEKEGTTLDDL